MEVFWIELGLLFIATGWIHHVQCSESDDGAFQEQRPAKKLRIVTIQLDPYVRFRWEPGLLGNQRYEGYYVDLINQVAESAGFEYQLQLAADGKVGQWNREDGWNGMLGELARGAADLALGPIAMTPDRTDLFEFTRPIAESHLSFLIRMDAATSRHITSFSDLLSQSEFHYGVIRGSDAEHLLSISNDRTMQQIWEKIQENRGPWKSENMFEALERIRRQNYALIADSDVARYYISQRPCDLAMIDIATTGFSLGFAVRNISQQLDDGINRVLAEVHSNTASWRRMRTRWWRRECSGTERDTMEDEDNIGTDSSLVENNTLVVPQLVPRRHLTIATMTSEPFFMPSRTFGQQWEGYIVDLVSKMADIVPFDYDWLVKDSVGRHHRGKWNGIIGELEKGGADFAAMPFQVSGRGTQRLSRVLSYTKPFLHSNFAVLIKPVSSSIEEAGFYLMEDLLNITSLQFGVVKGSRIERELKRSKNPLFKTIWKRITQGPAEHQQRHSQRGNIVHSLAQGVAKVREGNFAFIIESTEAAYDSSKRPCDLDSLDQFLSIANFGFALKKDNALVTDLDTAFLHLQDDSVLQSLFHRWFFNEGECEGMFTEEFPFSVVNSTQPYVISTITRQIEQPTSTILPTTVKVRRRDQSRRRNTTTTTTATTTTATTSPQRTTTPTTTPIIIYDTFESIGLAPILKDDNTHTVLPPITHPQTTSSSTAHSNSDDAHSNSDDAHSNSDDDAEEKMEPKSYEWFLQTALPRPEDESYEDYEYSAEEKTEEKVSIDILPANSTAVLDSIQSKSSSLHIVIKNALWIALIQCLWTLFLLAT